MKTHNLLIHSCNTEASPGCLLLHRRDHFTTSDTPIDITELSDPLFHPYGLEDRIYDLDTLTANQVYAEKEAQHTAKLLGYGFAGWTYAEVPDYWFKISRRELGDSPLPETVSGVKLVWRKLGTHPGGGYHWGSPAATVLVPVWSWWEASSDSSK